MTPERMPQSWRRGTACLPRAPLFSAPAASLCILLSACETPSKAPAPERGAGPARIASGPAPAMIDGEAVGHAALWPSLAEAGGADALREAALDRALELELRKRTVEISDRDIEAERTLLLESLSADRDTALRLLEELRRRDRLGPARLAGLLRRSAGLRALVRDQVQMTDDALRVAWDMAAGPRRQVRIMALATLADAEGASAAVRSGTPFMDVAVERSVDQSAARGGLLEPFSRLDPTYPESLRATAFSLQVGQLSSPVLLPQGYVVCTLVREIPASGQGLDSMRPQLERSVRLSQERLLMDQLARRLLRETRVTAIDDNLHWAWETRP